MNQQAKRESLEIYEDVMKDNGMAERESEALSCTPESAGWVCEHTNMEKKNGR